VGPPGWSWPGPWPSCHHTVRGNFRRIDPTQARIFLLEGTDRILPTYPPKLSERARATLTGLGVTVHTGAFLTDLRPGAVTVRAGGRDEEIRAETVLWAAGVDASPLGAALARATGAGLDRAGRVAVEPDLSLPGHPEVFVIGDLALCRGSAGKPVPGVAPAAIQQGTYVARLLVRRLRGEQVPPFRYKDRGSMAIIGRSAAVADLGFARFDGWLAWLAWLFLHLVELIEFENRLLVLVQWAWDYFTRNRAARLITGKWEGWAGPVASPPDAKVRAANGAS
jgi:NADH dehydrogenase